MDKRRIDFYCGTFLTGGIETTLIQLLKSINPDLFVIRLVVLFKTPKQELLISQIPNNVEIVYIVSSNILNSIRAKRLKGRIPLFFKILEEFVFLNIRRVIFHINIRKELRNADVIVDYGMCLINYPKLIRHRESIIYNHFSLHHINRSNQKKNMKKVLGLLNYSKVIAICDEMVEQFVAYYPNSSDRVVRIYNHINFQLVEERSLEGSISVSKPYILAIGRLDETQKDYATLLKGFAIARNVYDFDKDLVILGQGRDKEVLMQLCVELGIMNFVHFIGFDANPFKWLAKSDFFVHSSKFEGLPTVIIEAMILGKSIVASNCPTGVKELLLNGQAGLLFEVGNDLELASKLKMMSDGLNVNDIFAQGRKIVLDQFSVDATVRQIEKILLDI